MGDMADYYQAQDEERWDDPDSREAAKQQAKRLMTDQEAELPKEVDKLLWGLLLTDPKTPIAKKKEQAKAQINQLLKQQRHNVIVEIREGLPKRSRDYSKDNADQHSLDILVACSKTYNELLDDFTDILNKMEENDVK